MTLYIASREPSPAVKERILEGFGARLTRLRKGCGLTQDQLGEKVGLSRRMIAYYESTEAQPPGPILPDLARSLGVTVDQLLGMKPVKQAMSPRTARLLNRLRRIEQLPPKDQKQILDHLEALLVKNATGKRQARRAQAVGS